jgi:hypothetical protein
MDMSSPVCRKARDRFSPYFDGSLSSYDRSKLEEHLRVCDSCASNYRSFEALLRTARALPPIRPSADFDARLFARIRAEGRRPARSAWWQDVARIPLPVPLAAAAVLLVAVFSYTRLQEGPSTAGPAETATTASRSVPADPVPLRSNTLPSFLGDVGRPGGIGLEANAELFGPPSPGGGLPGSFSVVVLRDVNGRPLEGPYELSPRAESSCGERRARGDSMGKVDTSRSR